MKLVILTACIVAALGIIGVVITVGQGDPLLTTNIFAGVGAAVVITGLLLLCRKLS